MSDGGSGGAEELQPGEDIRPHVGPEEALTLAATLYGIPSRTRVRTLNAYDDKNFHLEVEEKSWTDNAWPYGYVFKVLNAFDSRQPEIVDAQNKLMLFLGENGIVCTQPIKNIHGKYFSIQRLKSPNKGEQKDHLVRLLTFQPGEIMYNIPCTQKLLYELGQYVANLNIILKNFQHPAYENHKPIWKLESVQQLGKFIFALEDTSKQTLATEIIHTFTNDIEPLIPSMDKGLLHGDINEQNILVQKSEDGEWHIQGIIDLGDSHISCYVFELAIAICYMMLQSKSFDPLEAPAHIMAGYSTKRKIPHSEYLILKKCICARLCQSLVMGAYSFKQDPTNKYLLTTAVNGWELLKKLWEIPEEHLHRQWTAIMETYS